MKDRNMRNEYPTALQFLSAVLVKHPGCPLALNRRFVELCVLSFLSSFFAHFLK